MQQEIYLNRRVRNRLPIVHTLLNVLALSYIENVVLFALILRLKKRVLLLSIAMYQSFTLNLSAGELSPLLMSK